MIVQRVYCHLPRTGTNWAVAKPQARPAARLVRVRASIEPRKNSVIDEAVAPNTAEAAQKYKWQFSSEPKAHHEDRQVVDLPIGAIRRPLGRTRGNDQEKVEALMKSIQEIGLQEPIDVLLVDGVYYGFSGCHRFEAHQRLGAETIRCRVRKANREVLKMHMM